MVEKPDRDRIGTVHAVVAAHQPTIVTVSNLPGEVRESVVLSPLHGRSTSREGPEGSVQTYEGKPPPGEGNVPEAMHRFADHLNGRAGRLIWREQSGQPADIRIDGHLERTDRNPAALVPCQVRRVVEQSTMEERGARRTGHRATTSLGAGDFLRNIIAAVGAKQAKAAQEVVLVLDAGDAPAYTDDPALIDHFREALVSSGLTNDWRGIWLVGPTIDRTYLLDGDRLNGEE